MDDCLRDRELLEAQFGYTGFYDAEPRPGWLLNYNVVKNESSELFVDLYFIGEDSSNFKLRIPYYLSFLVEYTGEGNSTEEYFMRRYEGSVHSVEHVERIDVAEHNHLNRPPKKFIKFCIKKEMDFLQIVKDMGCIVRGEDDIYTYFYKDSETRAYQLYEHDIPTDVQVGNTLNIRCGRWHSISYNGSDYVIAQNSRITYPELRIMAFDIETTKPPLKFPNAEHDQIMMISILTESFGELIINRVIVSEDIQEFEYEAKDEMKSAFRISNEPNEEALIIRFIELIQQHRPHIITTYNGGFFDWPFVEKRAAKYGISLEKITSIGPTHEYYESPFIMHLDCYKWVKRDSYLPMNNQGLKDAARIKLGYFPDEIDPEDMVRFAKEEPQKLASYSVSDAVATYYLYIKYVHPHIFSISSIIPLPTVPILCKGSGTLCEALLFSESIGYNLLVPNKRRFGGIEYFNGHIVENLTYVGGHVESLKAGIYRADFKHNFQVDEQMIDLIIDNLDAVLDSTHPDYGPLRQSVIECLNACRGATTQEGDIYHLDVGAMYPNIILTNRMQPIAIVNEDVCIHCDFNKPESDCKRKMAWVSRSEYLPPMENEVSMIKSQLRNETFYHWDRNTDGFSSDRQPSANKFGTADASEKAQSFKPNMRGAMSKGITVTQLSSDDARGARVSYDSLPVAKQERILRERVVEYSKKVYKRAKKIEMRDEELTVCQREVPFYVETVRKFRDQRNVVKGYYKDAMREYDADPSEENKKKIVVYNSLQVAYKCVLNSFYGYVMRTGSRWFSLEMAAAVCHAGGQIIRLARELVDRIGIPLELDTDGIWCLLPKGFPSTVMLGSKKVSLIGNILNYFVCKKFTNYQYQSLKPGSKPGDTVEYEKTVQNSILFEADGPYKTMIIPSSTEENKLLKKRYVVFNNDNTIAELKGFELKRRGELNIVKKFQEDIFRHFNDGATLQECYDSLASVCNYWLDIIVTKAEALSDDAVFDLFTEARNMSKSAEGYGDRKSNIMGTARKLAEFLGQEILEDKLKCEFIISRFPVNAPVAERCIPVLIFRHPEKEKYLKRWLNTGTTDLKRILDWDYYRKRFENILQRMIVIPAQLQHISNPLGRVGVPGWIKSKNSGQLGFIKASDIEDIGTKRSLTDVFYTATKRSHPSTPVVSDVPNSDGLPSTIDEEIPVSIMELSVGNEKADLCKLRQRMQSVVGLRSIMDESREKWLQFFNRGRILVQVSYLAGGQYMLKYLDGTTVTKDFKRKVFLDVNSTEHFAGYNKIELHLQEELNPTLLTVMEIDETEVATKKYKNFFEHFSIKNAFNRELDPHYQLGLEHGAGGSIASYATVSSFIYQKAPIFAITAGSTTVFISSHKHMKGIAGAANWQKERQIWSFGLQDYKETRLGDCQVIIYNKADPNSKEITEVFNDCILVALDLVRSTYLESLDSLLRRQCDLQLKMKLEFHSLQDISLLFDIPLLNVPNGSLDVIYYKEMYKAGVLCIASDEFVQNVIKEESYKSGYHGTCTVQLECTGSLILAIIEYNYFIGSDSLFDGVKKREFTALREFLKKLLIASLKNNMGATSLLEGIAIWLKKNSRLISAELRDIVNIIHQKYILTLVHHLKEMQCKVVSVSKELIIIDTLKRDDESCDAYIEYVQRKVSEIAGYELLNLSVVRKMERLGFVHPACYYYVEDGEIRVFSDIDMPRSFMELYFGDVEITNEMVYSMIRKVDIAQAKLFLRLLSYKRDTHGLVSNCYKLLKVSEFSRAPEYQSNLTVFCTKCGMENLLRKRCLKCYSEIDKMHLENECARYLRYLWSLQIGGDRQCSACQTCEERKLKDYCKCGGRFVQKDYSSEIEALRTFVDTRKFDEQVQEVVEYFK